MMLTRPRFGAGADAAGAGAAGFLVAVGEVAVQRTVAPP